LAKQYGLAYVGYYLSAASLITLVSLLLIKGNKQ
jgi:Na+(H+)/acetate symporter ActP